MKKAILINIVILLMFTFLGTMSGHAYVNSQENDISSWKSFETNFQLKKQTMKIVLQYPDSWFVEDRSDAYQLTFQNVPFSSCYADLGENPSLAIEKISFMLDPKPSANTDWISLASHTTINGQEWLYSLNEDISPDTDSMTFETRINGSLFRVYLLVSQRDSSSIQRTEILDGLVHFVDHILFGEFIPNEMN